jgi:hypothetical protein
MRTVARLIALATLCTASHVSQAQDTLNLNEKATGLMPRAMGYLLGQHLRLDRIEQHHPGLAVAVIAARSRLDSAFPDAMRNMERTFLANGVSQAQLDELAAGIKAKMVPILANEPIDAASARSFLEAVHQRAKGVDVPEEVLAYLLSASFVDAPQREFQRGWTTSWTSKGHPKTKGTEVVLQLPRSFSKKESSRPNIVATWTSQHGDGPAMLMIMVRETTLPALSRRAVETDLARGAASELAELGDDTKLISAKVFSQELAHGVVAEYQTTSDRAGNAAAVRQRTYTLYLNKRGVSLLCSVGTRLTDIDRLEAKMSKMRPLCDAVANSLVLPQQY